MSYQKKNRYGKEPSPSYKIRRNCSGCGKKAVYYNTECFRVNANGGLVDVWLIYQCGKCRHTYNLSIYERTPVGKIPADDYIKFMENDSALAGRMGRDKSLFRKNRAEII